jgi:hypothetical protein
MGRLTRLREIDISLKLTNTPACIPARQSINRSRIVDPVEMTDVK